MWMLIPLLLLFEHFLFSHILSSLSISVSDSSSNLPLYKFGRWQLTFPSLITDYFKSKNRLKLVVPIFRRSNLRKIWRILWGFKFINSSSQYLHTSKSLQFKHLYLISIISKLQTSQMALCSSILDLRQDRNGEKTERKKWKTCHARVPSQLWVEALFHLEKEYKTKIRHFDLLLSFKWNLILVK